MRFHDKINVTKYSFEGPTFTVLCDCQWQTMMVCCGVKPVFGLALPGKRDSMELAGIKGQTNTKTRLANRLKEYWLGVQAVLINPQGKYEQSLTLTQNRKYDEWTLRTCGFP